MNRLARVVAKSSHSVILDLLQTQKCAGCPSNCNKPLFKLFSLKDNLFTLSTNDRNYELVDEDRVFQEKAQLGQTVQIKIEQLDLLKSSAILYFLPLLICILFITLGHWVGEWLQLSQDLFSFLGLLLGFLTIYVLFTQEIIIKYLKFRPKVTIL